MVKSKKSSYKRRILIALLSSAVIFLLWTLLYFIVGNEYILPSPLASFQSAFTTIGTGVFLKAFLSTLLRTFIAFMIALIFSLVLAVVGYVVPVVSEILRPIVTVVRSLPVMAILLMIIIWTNPLKAPVFVAFLAVFPILYSDVSSALEEIPEGIISMSKIYGVPLGRKITWFYLPFIYPYIVRSSASSLSFSLKVIVSAEILSKTYNSIGGLMQEARAYLEMKSLFALAIIVVISGFIIESLVLTLLLFRRSKNDYS